MKFSEIVRLGVQGRFCGRILPRSRRIPAAILPCSCRIPAVFPSQTATNLLRSTPYAVYTVCLKQVRR